LAALVSALWLDLVIWSPSPYHITLFPLEYRHSMKNCSSVPAVKIWIALNKKSRAFIVKLGVVFKQGQAATSHENSIT